MDGLNYPFVSELAFRAKKHSVQSLTLIPMIQIWQVEPIRADVALKQLNTLLQSSSFSRAEKLKLGFLIAYSWPLHFHPHTLDIANSAKRYVSSEHPAESLLLLGILASCDARNNQFHKSIICLTAAYDWAALNATTEELLPLLRSTTLSLMSNWKATRHAEAF